MKAITEQGIAETSAKIGRSCGECSLCCLLLDVPEADKPVAEWCPHCRPGKGGCSIYQNRPSRCRTYTCAWLVNPKIPDHWHPLRSHMIVDFKMPEGEDTAVMRIHIENGYHDRFQEEPFKSDIVKWAWYGKHDSKIPFRVAIIQCEGSASRVKTDAA